MRRVRRKHTGPEMLVRRALWQRNLRYRLHADELPGSPDIVFRASRVAVFVHGCFWHRHDGCRLATSPKTNTDFWLIKFAANVERDRRKVRELEAMGWEVFVVWQCEAENDDVLERRVDAVERSVRRSSRRLRGRVPRP